MVTYTPLLLHGQRGWTVGGREGKELEALEGSLKVNMDLISKLFDGGNAARWHKEAKGSWKG
jgi:hypothetical protein